MLEDRHRVEEDLLYREFHQMRSKEEEKAIQGIQEEWEVELTKLTAKFERDLQLTSTRNRAGVWDPNAAVFVVVVRWCSHLFLLCRCKNDGNAVAHSILLVSKIVRKQGPLKINKRICTISSGGIFSL